MINEMLIEKWVFTNEFMIIYYGKQSINF